MKNDRYPRGVRILFRHVNFELFTGISYAAFFQTCRWNENSKANLPVRLILTKSSFSMAMPIFLKLFTEDNSQSCINTMDKDKATCVGISRAGLR